MRNIYLLSACYRHVATGEGWR